MSDELKQKYVKVLAAWMARGVVGAIGLTTFATAALSSVPLSQSAPTVEIAPVSQRLAAIRAAVSALDQNGETQPSPDSVEKPRVKTAQWQNWSNTGSSTWNNWSNWNNWNNWNKPWFNWSNTGWGNY